MRDYLEELCTRHKINLQYIEGDFTALSVGIENDVPFIKVNRIFEDCPEEIAKAIFDYYTGTQNESQNLQILKDYIDGNVISVEYTIVPPDEVFKNLFVEHIDTEATTKTKKPRKRTSKGKMSKKNTSINKTPDDDTSSIIELDISSIIQKGFWDNYGSNKSNGEINASADDVIEVDVVVDDSKLE